jgi:hypothetical protein
MFFCFAWRAKWGIVEMKGAGPGDFRSGYSWFGYSFIRNRIFTRTVMAIKPTTTFRRIDGSIMEGNLLSGFGRKSLTRA